MKVLFNLFATLMFLGSSALLQANPLVGTWVNTDANTRDITHLVVTHSHLHRHPGQLSVHVYGKCHPTDCDWGSAPLFFENGQYRAAFNQGFAQKSLTLREEHGRFMHVTNNVHFTDGRSPYVSEMTFRHTH